MKLEIFKANAENTNLEVEEISIGSIGWMEREDIDEETDSLLAMENASTAEVIDEVEAKHLVSEINPAPGWSFATKGMKRCKPSSSGLAPSKMRISLLIAKANGPQPCRMRN